MARSLEQSKRELETQNEQLRQSERLKSELISIVSHELRTPLASIMGYASLLLKRDFRKADAERYLEVIHGQGSRLSSLVEDFLDVESVEAGRLELKNESVDLKQVLNDEAELVAKETTRHRIEVVTRADSLPVRGDHDRLAQVYGNLLTNAIKYSPNGGLVEVLGTISDGSVRVEVHDEGIGIPDRAPAAHLHEVLPRRGAGQRHRRQRPRPDDVARDHRGARRPDRLHERSGPRQRVLVRAAAGVERDARRQPELTAPVARLHPRSVRVSSLKPAFARNATDAVSSGVA